jgi:hypothetical protein
MANRSSAKTRRGDEAPPQELIIEGQSIPVPPAEAAEATPAPEQVAKQPEAAAQPAARGAAPGHAPSPLIMQLSWGKMVIEGLGSGRDFKLYPGGARPWDWSEHDTHHMPGIQIADVQELVDRGCKVVVLTRGMDLVLHVKADTLAFLRERGIEVYVEETRAAADRYNQLALADVAVGGLFHSTC